ncbi:GIY-YIG nuclease family protein [Colwellia asteriadis]
MTMQTTWWVYLLRCNDNSLYTGITTDVSRRLHEHNTSKLGAKYTRAKRPVTLAYQEEALNKSTAASREYQLRKLTKQKKEHLVDLYTKKHQ